MFVVFVILSLLATTARPAIHNGLDCLNSKIPPNLYLGPYESFVIVKYRETGKRLMFIAFPNDLVKELGGCEAIFAPCFGRY